MIEDLRAEFSYSGLLNAIQRHDNDVLFEWLVRAMSYQGVSDLVAATYLDKHGSISVADVERCINVNAPCPKLESYWSFKGCGYRKSAASCNQPHHFAACRLPKLPARNGSLGQAGVSLHLFLRDIAGGDFVAWLDTRLEQADRPKARDRVKRLGHHPAEKSGARFKANIAKLRALKDNN